MNEISRKKIWPTDRHPDRPTDRKSAVFPRSYVCFRAVYISANFSRTDMIRNCEKHLSIYSSV